MKGSNLAVTNIESILLYPIMWNGPSIVSPYFWCSGSNSLHALHTFAISPDDDENVSLPSMVSIGRVCFVFLFDGLD